MTALAIEIPTSKYSIPQRSPSITDELMRALPRLSVEHDIPLRTLLGRVERGWHRNILFAPPLRRGERIVEKSRPGTNLAVHNKRTVARWLAADLNYRELLSRPLIQEEEPPVQLRVVRATAPAPAEPTATPAPRDTIPIRTPSLTLYRVRNTPIYLAFNGMRLRLSEWARRLGMKYSTLYSRYRKGWSDVMILTTADGRARRVRRLLFYRTAV